MRPYRAEAIKRHWLFLLRLLLFKVSVVPPFLLHLLFMKAPPPPLFGHALHLGQHDLGQHDRSERVAPLRSLTQRVDQVGVRCTANNLVALGAGPMLSEVVFQKRARVVVRDDVRLPLDDKTEDPVTKRCRTNWAQSGGRSGGLERGVWRVRAYAE